MNLEANVNKLLPSYLETHLKYDWFGVAKGNESSIEFDESNGCEINIKTIKLDVNDLVVDNQAIDSKKTVFEVLKSIKRVIKCNIKNMRECANDNEKYILVLLQDNSVNFKFVHNNGIVRIFVEFNVGIYSLGEGRFTFTY